MTTPHICIPYLSPKGHTKAVVDAIAAGVAIEGLGAYPIAVDGTTDADWALLDSAGGIIFGAPTYMGSVPAAYKLFMDQSSMRWLKQSWKDKIAGGFTNSGAYSGDKLSTLSQLNIFAMQHSMIWVGTGLTCPIGPTEPPPQAINRLGSFLGVMTFATDAAADITPPSGDLETAKLYGQRIAQITKSFTPA